MMQLDLKTGLTVVSMVVAAVSAFFAYQISTQSGFNKLEQRITKLELTDPLPGPRGLPGEPGNPGKSVTAQEVAAFLLANHEDDIRGPRGEPGQNGVGAPIPNGLVIASLKRCSDLGAGWSNYDAGAGRVIVGFGETTIASTIRRFLFEETDGHWEHQLTIAEMPRHAHGGSLEGVDTFNSVPDAAYKLSVGATPSQPGTGVGFDLSVKHRHQIPLDGGDQPHNNMPPYIALYFCKKEAG